MACNTSIVSVNCLFALYFTDAGLSSQTSSNPEVKALVRWLKSVPVDQDTINKVNSIDLQLLFLLTALFFHSGLCRIAHLPTAHPHVFVFISSWSLMSSPWTACFAWPPGMTWHTVESGEHHSHCSRPTWERNDEGIALRGFWLQKPVQSALLVRISSQSPTGVFLSRLPNPVLISLFRGGMLCRVWAAITAHRNTQLSEDGEDTPL